MSQVKSVHGGILPSETTSASVDEEGREDHLDYCAAAEAIDEALEKGGIKKTRDFAKELGLDI